MIQDPLIHEAAPELWEDSIWDWLLESLAERSVIPIVGPDLVHVEVEGTTTLLDQFIARKLAHSYDLPVDGLPAERALNTVVCRLMRFRNKERYGICRDINRIMKETELRPSRALLQLAEITDFKLFVTTTFDTLLEKALEQIRFPGAGQPDSIAYSPKKVHDLPAAKEELTKPTVYHLMGKLSPIGDYVISEEDLLERVCELQSDNRRPHALFDELKKNHLLILGEDYSDWMVRIFLRTAKGGRLSATHDSLEILADGRTHRDPGLVSFLVHFSNHTKVFQTGGAVEFVDQLWTRWRERHADVPSSGPPARGVFISYAREDVAAARELKAGLEDAGLPVWFDQKTLKAGESFNPRIEQYISEECKCFVAVISQSTERRTAGFFRREWNIALDRDREIYHGRGFIVPVVVDDTAKPSVVPPRFTQLNYKWLPGGRVTERFVEDLRTIVNGP